MKRFVLFVLASFLFFVATYPVLAQNNGAVDIGNPILNFQQNPDVASVDSVHFLQGRLGNLLGLMLRGLAVLSLLPIVYGGFLMITSQGNSDQVGKGKSALFWGIIGLTLAFMAILLYSLLLRILLPASS